MTIKARLYSLAVAFVLVASLITALAITTVMDNRAVITAYTDASQNALRGEKLNRYLVTIAVELRGIYMSKTREETLWRADRVDQNLDRVNALLSEWYNHVKPGELPELDAVNMNLKPAIAGSRNLARLAREVSREAAEAAGNHDTFRVGRENMQARMDKMIARLEDRLKQSRANLDHFEQERLRSVLFIAAGGIVLLLGGAWWVAAGMATRLREIRRSIVRISEGAYETMVPLGDTGDEIDEIWGALAILKARAIEADRLTREALEREHKHRELMLD